MSETDLKTLLKEIDSLVTEAGVTFDPAEKIKLVQKALFKACTYLKELNKRIPKIIAEVLQRGNLDPNQVLPFRDIAFNEEQLEVFRSEEALLQFLETVRELLLAKMTMTNDEIDELIRHTRQLYDVFMDEQFSQDSLLENFKILQKHFCTPPDGGPGSPSRGPNDEPPESKAEKRLSILGILSSIGSFILDLLKIGATGQAALVPYPYQVLAISLFTGLARQLEAGEKLHAGTAGPAYA